MPGAGTTLAPGIRASTRSYLPASHSETMTATPRIDPSLTVNEILRRYPHTIATINAFGIDTCCGGGIPLETVARTHALELDTIMAALDAAIHRGAA